MKIVEVDPKALVVVVRPEEAQVLLDALRAYTDGRHTFDIPEGWAAIAKVIVSALSRHIE